MQPWYKQPVSIFTGVYVLLRVLSLLTWQHSALNETIAVILTAGFATITWKRLSWGWQLLLGEIILGGASHFFELKGFLLRTWLLAIFAIIWLVKAPLKQFYDELPNNVRIGTIIYIFLLAFATANGLYHDHTPILIVQDGILYGFFFLYFFAYQQKQLVTPLLASLGKAFIIGSAIFSSITFWFYSLGLGTLQDTYYDWFRNIAAGKITDLGYNFYRIVLPEHLFLIPAFTILAAILIKQSKRNDLWIYAALTAILLALNFTRIYFLALPFSFLALFNKKYIKNWLFTSVAFASLIFLSLAGFTAIASGGQSIGLELLGVKASGITSPTGDLSGATRLAILPDALQQIRANPLFGTGLGTTVTFINPLDNEPVTRTQFDWGYLEMAAELGIVGTTLFLLLVVLLLIHFRKDITSSTHLGLFAAVIGLFVINITTPALFQGFGVLMIAAMTSTIALRAPKNRMN